MSIQGDFVIKRTTTLSDYYLLYKPFQVLSQFTSTDNKLCLKDIMDVPKDVLGQLGLKIQHALRAFTAADRKVIKQAAENYPETEFYQTDELLTQLGIGEALVTMLNEKGIPTPLVHVLLISPRSRMDILSEEEIGNLVNSSKLAKKYNQITDSDSAYEMLTAKPCVPAACGPLCSCS